MSRQPVKLRLKDVRSKDFKQIFAEGGIAYNTPLGLKLNFFTTMVNHAKNDPAGDPTEVERVFHIEVVLPPLVAKEVAMLMVRRVKDWEEQFGKIPVKSDLEKYK